MTATPECECGAPLNTMAAQSTGRCHLCEARQRDAVKEKRTEEALALEHLADMAIAWDDDPETVQDSNIATEAALEAAIQRVRETRR